MPKKTSPEIESIPIGKLIPYANNPKKHPEKQVSLIAGSIAEFGFLVPLVVDAENIIVSGHGRYEAALKLGLDSLPCIRAAHLTEAQIKAFRLADNKIAEGEWDPLALDIELKGLAGEGFDLSIAGFDGVADAGESATWGEGAKLRDGEIMDPDGFLELTAEQRERFTGVRRVYVLYSGGMDSTGALLWAAANFDSVTAVFIDPGVEFGSLIAHVIDITAGLGVELEILKPSTCWWRWIQQNGWPSIIYRPCATKFIHDPWAKFMKNHDPTGLLLVDGSRMEERVMGSKKTIDSPYPNFGSARDRYATYHPCFNLTKDGLGRVLEIAKAPQWEGYQRNPAFVRTACWCCPGQCSAQAHALATHYPGLADEIRWWERRIGPLERHHEKSFDDFASYGASRAASPAP